MIRRPPRSTRVRSSAASDVYKRQGGRTGALERACALGRGRVSRGVPGRWRPLVHSRCNHHGMNSAQPHRCYLHSTTSNNSHCTHINVHSNVVLKYKFIGNKTKFIITFCVSRRRRKIYCGHARLCVCVSMSAAIRPHYCMDRDVTWGHGRGCPLVVHHWADLQSAHGLRCYGNITRTLVTSLRPSRDMTT